MKETTVQGHPITKKAVAAYLRGTEPVPPLKNASFYVVREDGAKVGAKEVIYALTDGAGHWGNEAAQALLRLGFTVRVRRRAATHAKPPYDAFFEAGLLLFDEPEPPKPPAPERDNDFDPAALKDNRDKVVRGTHPRAGQLAFRKEVRAAYRDRCAITGSPVTTVLEAAHIAPHRGREFDRIENGILLRADLHLLFDAGLIGIVPETFSVVMDGSLRETNYWRFNGKRLRLPMDRRQHPSPKALAFRLETIGPATTGAST